MGYDDAHEHVPRPAPAAIDHVQRMTKGDELPSNASRSTEAADTAAAVDGLSPLERELMEYLWSNGAAGVTGVMGYFKEDKGRTYALTTISTLLRRLQAKGFVSKRPGLRGAYVPVAVPDFSRSAAKASIRSLIDKYGTTTVATAIAELISDGEVVLIER